MPPPTSTTSAPPAWPPSTSSSTADQRAGRRRRGPVRATYPAAAGGSFGPYGAPGVRIGTGDPVLPLSLAVGGWLLEQTKAAQLPRAYVAVPVDATPADCLRNSAKKLLTATIGSACW